MRASGAYAAAVKKIERDDIKWKGVLEYEIKILQNPFPLDQPQRYPGQADGSRVMHTPSDVHPCGGHRGVLACRGNDSWTDRKEAGMNEGECIISCA